MFPDHRGNAFFGNLLNKVSERIPVGERSAGSDLQERSMRKVDLRVRLPPFRTGVFQFSSTEAP